MFCVRFLSVFVWFIYVFVYLRLTRNNMRNSGHVEFLFWTLDPTFCVLHLHQNGLQLKTEGSKIYPSINPSIFLQFTNVNGFPLSIMAFDTTTITDGEMDCMENSNLTLFPYLPTKWILFELELKSMDTSPS